MIGISVKGTDKGDGQMGKSIYRVQTVAPLLCRKELFLAKHPEGRLSVARVHLFLIPYIIYGIYC